MIKQMPLWCRHFRCLVRSKTFSAHHLQISESFTKVIDPFFRRKRAETMFCRTMREFTCYVDRAVISGLDSFSHVTSSIAPKAKPGLYIPTENFKSFQSTHLQWKVRTWMIHFVLLRSLYVLLLRVGVPQRLLKINLRNAERASWFLVYTFKRSREIFIAETTIFSSTIIPTKNIFNIFLNFKESTFIGFDLKMV